MEIVLQYRKLYCSEVPRMGWKCIAIHWFVLQRRGLKLYCQTVMYCDLEAARLGLYCRIVLWQEGWMGKICIAIQKKKNGIVTVGTVGCWTVS